MTDAPAIAPRGSEKRQRSQLVQVRCTPGEYALIETAAERAGLTIGAFVRAQCIGTPGPRAVRRPPVERAALAQLLGLLGRAGSNINQIAKALNSGSDRPAEIPAAIDAVRAAAAEILQLLGKRPM